MGRGIAGGRGASFLVAALALISMLTIPEAALARAAPRSASVANAASAHASTATARCADVLFVGARGSGEKGPGDRGWKPSKSDPYGLGGTVDSARRRLAADLAGHRTMKVESVSYVANGVQTLLHAPRQYFANLAVGVTWTLGVLGGQARKCPAQQLVLAGFSQGAMVMHRVLHDLGKTGRGRAILGRVAAAILIGDGDQVPYDREVRYGTAGAGAHGIGHLWPRLSGSAGSKFSPSLRTRVLRVCNHRDPVCDVTPNEFDFRVHLRYPGGKALMAAADRAAQDIRELPLPAPRILNLDVNAGIAVSHQLTADVQPGYRLQWVLAPKAVLPAGLKLSASGKISGTPASPGSRTTQIRVRARHAGSKGPWVPTKVRFTITSFSAAWTATTAPLPAGTDDSPNDAAVTVQSAACGSSCVAVGYHFNGPSGAPGLYLEAMVTAEVNGMWQSINAPMPSGAGTVMNSDLVSVSCVPGGNCTAVGYYQNATGEYGLLLTGSGASWSAVTAPMPAGGLGGDLTSVACPAADQCVAVGDYTDQQSASSYRDSAMVLTQSGSSWVPAAAPEPGDVSTVSTYPEHLGEVACSAAGTCAASGYYINSAGQAQFVMLSQDNGPWIAIGVAPPPNAYTGLDGTQPYLGPTSMTCPSTDCTVSGTYMDSGSGSYGYLITGAGTAWTATEDPQDAEPLAAVSCAPGTGACAAVGSRGWDTQQLYLYSGSGASWDQTTVTSPVSDPGADTVLTSVACPASSACIAVGHYSSVSEGWQSLLVTGSGTSWASGLAPLPPGTGSSPYVAPAVVACASAARCVAFGTYVSGTTKVLVLTGPA